MNPTTKPSAMMSGIRIIWDIPAFQKKSRNVTTWVFWISMIRNKTIKTNTAISFGLIINPLSQDFSLNGIKKPQEEGAEAPSP
jgi:hypothetical protein